MNRLFAYLGKTCILGKIWDITMHLTIYLNILDYVEAISLQTAVEVMQIVDAAYLACSSIEELGRDGLAQRISFFTVLLLT